MSRFLIACLLSLVLIQPAFAEAGGTRSRIKIRKKSYLARTSPNESKEYDAEKMELLAKERRSLMLQIKSFIRDAHDEDQKTELNLRLGNLYMEDYYAGLAKAEQRFDRESKAFEAARKDKRKAGRAPKLDDSDAVASLDKARAIYRDLLNRYPSHPRRDEMLYSLATASLDRGLTDEGMRYLTQLSTQFPTSRYANDALVQLGDHLFDANQFTQAEKIFDKIIQKRYKPLLAYAVYKKGWCAYNTDRKQLALSSFKWVIQNEDAEDTGAPIRVKGEALKDITLAFVDLKLLDESIAFFRSVGEPYNRNGLQTMAALYFEQADNRDAIALWETLLKMDENYSKNPSYDLSVIEALRLSGDVNGAVNRLFARLPAYTSGSTWYEINAASPQVIRDAVNGFEETARKYAFQFHAEGQKMKNEALYNVAKQLYAKYIEFFPHTTHVAKVRFYLAEILYRQGQYVQAADQYYLVYNDPGAGALKLDAIRHSLQSLDRRLNEDRKQAGLAVINSKTTSKLKEEENASLEALPYSEAETKFIEIADEYLRAYEGQKDAPDVLYEQAYLQYTHHELTKAYNSFWKLVTKFPRHETAYASAYLILDILNRHKDYPKLIAACKKFLDQPALAKPSFQAVVSDVLRKSELKRIQLIEAKGGLKEAADAYIEYTQAYGNQDEALFEKALYNASVDYAKANLLMSAVETEERFLRRFPKSSFRESMLLQVAKTYESLATFDKAGAYFELFATNYPNNPQAKNALELAGLYFWGSGATHRAETVMTSYLRAYPETPEAKAVEKQLLDLYESSGLVDKELHYLLTARAQRGLPLSQYVVYSLKIAQLAQLAQRSGSGDRMALQVMDEALRVASRSVRDISATPAGVEALSKLYFWVAKQKESAYYGIKLSLPQQTLETNLQRKLTLMKELERDFQHIAGLGSAEWGLGAIYKTAAIYHHMAESVLQAPVPNELSADQIETYRAELNRQMIQPFNEKALSLVTQCLDKSQELNLLSSWTPQCYSLASQLQPERYPIARTFYLPALQTALMLPQPSQSKISVGKIAYYAYPFYSSWLFKALPDAIRRLGAGVGLYDNRTLEDSAASVPAPISYNAMADERQSLLRSAFEASRPSDPHKGLSFAFLNLTRLVAPQRALPLVLQAIQKDPANPALHNLLGLSYLESGNLPAAQVTWLSLVARGVKNAAVWNNLGIAANLEGNESEAIDYFQEASRMESPREALVNLGFLALKYRNGFEAKQHFQKALELSKDDATARVGLAIAEIQNREMDAAKDNLVDLTKRYKRDPYARLALGYYLMDVEKDNDLARKVLSDYVEGQTNEDILFRQAIQETKHNGGSNQDGGLPTIE